MVQDDHDDHYSHHQRDEDERLSSWTNQPLSELSRGRSSCLAHRVGRPAEERESNRLEMPAKSARRRVSFNLPQQPSDSEPDLDGASSSLSVVVEPSCENGAKPSNEVARVASLSAPAIGSDGASDYEARKASDRHLACRKDEGKINNQSKDNRLDSSQGDYGCGNKNESDSGIGSDSDDSNDNESDGSKSSSSNCSESGNESDSDSDSKGVVGEQSDVFKRNISKSSQSVNPSGNSAVPRQLKGIPRSSALGEIDSAPQSTEPMSEIGPSSFDEMALDKRISWAIAKLGWHRPTPVQKAAIPAALAGRDVLVSAPTGSGKTASYAVPLAHRLCQAESAREHNLTDGAMSVVLVPTRELAAQVAGQLRKILRFVQGARVAIISTTSADSSLNPRATSFPRPTKRQRQSNDSGRDGCANGQVSTMGFVRSANILVGTPAALASLRKDHGNSVLSRVSFFVVDEADLVLSFGHGPDARAALAVIPSTAQAMLVSATLDVSGLPEMQKIVLRRPLSVKITATPKSHTSDAAGVGPGALHYFARLSSPADRYLVTYVMLRLNVISGKVLIFTNGIGSSFKLKLFLDKFKIKAAVLNSELPGNSRVHCVEQFNAGVFDVLIASDEVQRDDMRKEPRGHGQKRSKPSELERSDDERGLDTQPSGMENRKGKGNSSNSNENRWSDFGVSRGVDFRGVSAVVNFDVPKSVASYTHRAGRTARAGASGTVLSLPVGEVEQIAVASMARSSGIQIGPLAFRMDQIEAFRYRVEDSLRTVTEVAVRDARLADVRREMINSDRLKEYFEDNPLDLDALKHDEALAKDVPEHLARVPAYLLPPALRGSVSCDPVSRSRRGKVRNHSGPGFGGGSGKNGAKNDPLKAFSSRKGKGKSGSTSRDRYKAKHGVKKSRQRFGRKSF